MKWQLLVVMLAIGALAMSAHAEEFAMKSWGEGAPGLHVSLPAGWTYVPREGPDFDVHFFTGPGDQCTIGIYVGMHPNPRARAEPEGIQSRTAGRVLGKVVHWTDMRRHGEAGEFSFSEAIVEHAFAGKATNARPVVNDLSLHLMISAPTPQLRDSCRELLSALDLAR